MINPITKENVQEIKSFFSGLFGILKILFFGFVLWLIVSTWWNGKQERKAAERTEQNTLKIIQIANETQQRLITYDSIRAATTNAAIKDIMKFDKDQDKHQLGIDEIVKLLNLR